MFRNIELYNFRSFDHIQLDLTGPKGAPLGHAMIYGENGSGKTNLMESIEFLKETVNTLVSRSEFELFIESMNVSDDERIVDSAMDRISGLLTRRSPDLPELKTVVGMRRMIDSDGPMVARYQFSAEGIDVVYSMEFDMGNRVSAEELKIRAGGRIGTLYRISSADGISVDFNRSLFKSKKYRMETEERVRRLWGNHTFLSIMNMEYRRNNRGYMDSVFRSDVSDVIRYIDSIVTNLGSPNPPGTFLGDGDLISGIAAHSERRVLNAYGNAISRFFCRLYSDVAGVRYEITETDNRELRYELIFDKRIAGRIRSIPARFESSGTKVLISLIPALMGCAEGRTAFIDELDNGIHDKLIFDLMEQIMPDLRGQLVVTTHNTSLLESSDPGSTFILRVDAEGFKEVVPIKRISRTQKNNNNRQRYLNGQFDGVPIIGMIDLKGISDAFGDEVDDA